jgi:hypothetical protein
MLNEVHFIFACNLKSSSNYLMYLYFGAVVNQFELVFKKILTQVCSSDVI